VTLERDAVTGPSGLYHGYEDALVPPPSHRQQPRTGRLMDNASRRDSTLLNSFDSTAWNPSAPIEYAARSVSASLAPRLAAERQRRLEEVQYSQRVAVETRAAFGGDPQAEASSVTPRPSWLQNSIERAAHAAALAVLSSQSAASKHKPGAETAQPKISLAASAAVGHAGRGVQYVATMPAAQAQAVPGSAHNGGVARGVTSGVAGVSEGLARDLLAERDRQLERRVGRDPESVRLARIMSSSSGRVG